MVRVLSCYHFRGQKIGRCDEAAAVTVAGQSIVVGIEDSINVYNAGHGYQSPDVDIPFDIGNSGTQNYQIPEIGVPITFGQGDKSPLSPGDDKRLDSEQRRSGSCSSSVSSIESDTEIKLSHSFSTVDLVRSLSYNRKGNYLLCLECRDGDGGASRCSSIRVYFYWDRKCDGQPMRTRIAGVSPSSNDLEKPGLTMVEIPLTSPAIAVASCTLSGHLASLSAESVINIFSFRVKDVSGRGKMQYHDFDRLCAVELPGFAPESLSFLGNFVVCQGPGKIHVFQIQKSDKSWSPSVIASAKSISRVSGRGPSYSKIGNKNENISNPHFDHSNKVTFDPADDSVTVHLPSVTRANRKRAGNTIVAEEYGGEIFSNKSRIIFSSAVAGLNVEDILRLSFPQVNPATNVAAHERFSGAGLYPVRINDKLGGVACAVGLTKEAMLFHLPTKEGSHPVCVAKYNFTAPLVTFTFDSLFFHALTESGLETYTSRSLYYALEDHEGFDRYCNACPLKSERPCLVGIRPFVRVRFMAANESLICLLACPTPMESGTSQQTTFSPPLSPSNALLQDERLWTVYSLELPDIDMLYEDTMRLTKNQENQPDSYFMLLCELYLILRAYLNAVPEDTHYNMPRYRSLCKAIGLEYLKASWALKCDSRECGNPETITHANSSQTTLSSPSSEELLEFGVTYLNMAKLDIPHLFSPENSELIQDPQYIGGTVRLIDVLLSSCFEQDSADKHNFSPALSSSIVDFLSRYSPETLVDLVIRISFLRENHSTKLIEILQEFAQASNYAGKETVALILTFIAAGGVESNVRSQVQDILSKVKSQDLLEPCIRLEFILDRNAKHSVLTDVAICLTAVNSELPTSIISKTVKNQDVSVSEVMLAFAKAVNLNSESQIQRSLAKALRTILESYFSSKISNNNNISDLSQNLSNSNVSTSSVHFTDDERHAVQALVRSYISDIPLSPTNKLIKSTTAESSTLENSQITDSVDSSIDPENSNHEKTKQSENDSFTPETVNGTEIMARNQIFGKSPSFVNFLLSIDMPGGSITPANMTFSPTMFPNQESMESYIRLLSVLSSPLGKVEGVKDSVLSFVYNNSSSVKSTPLQLILQMFCEPVETAISILISRQPTTVLLYAKEMFGKSTPKWKMLVAQLKKRINLNPDTTDSDMFSTIIESVYLHLANTLSLTELEEVLEKGSDDVAKFRSTCKRVELANSYASMVIQISTDYLQNK